MKIKYLGTAAYEGVPSLFCTCDVCKESIKLKGRNLRSRSQALINNDLLVDFNADTVWHYINYNFDWTNIHDCLITHSHCDHLYVDDMEMIRNGYAKCEGYYLNYYAGKSGYDMINNLLSKDSMKGKGKVTLLEDGKIFQINDYKIMAIKANHDPKSSPFIFAIEQNGKKLLYGNDSGWLCENSWNHLKKFGPFDLVSLDCTAGLLKNWRDNHLSFDIDLEIFSKMLEDNIINNKTIKVVNHFSHNGKATYDTLSKVAKEYGVVVSYDGLEIEI